jgi:Icc-related predicted phosphoesterase
MKLLAFVDVHANQLALKELARKAKDADLLLCAGDVSIFGRGLLETLKTINSWNKPCLILHGNHEDEEEMQALVDALPNLHWIHGCEVQIGDLSVIGWGGGGFAREDPMLESWVAHLEPHPLRVFVMHGPPYNTAIDEPYPGEHVGCKTRRAVIEHLQPLLAIAGHIHENFGERSKVGETLVLNPGPLGTVIDLQPKAQQTAKKTSKKRGGTA